MSVKIGTVFCLEQNPTKHTGPFPLHNYPGLMLCHDVVLFQAWHDLGEIIIGGKMMATPLVLGRAESRERRALVLFQLSY